jgi:hypothetical protein
VLALEVAQGNNMNINKEPNWLDEPEIICKQCDDCPFPNGCIRECVILAHINEDVAEIRGEKE